MAAKNVQLFCTKRSKERPREQIAKIVVLGGSSAPRDVTRNDNSINQMNVRKREKEQGQKMSEIINGTNF